jgi:pimeloyl-ACP methyl ester carboxylesterase
MATRLIRTRTLLVACAVLAAALLGIAVWARSHHGGPRPNHVVRDPSLRSRGIVIYTPRGTPRALVLFFGNDVGFWRPHHALAAELASQGYAVAGIDIRPLFGALPEGHPSRDSSCAAAIRDIATRVNNELALESVPIVIAGHSLGAELASWAAAHAGVPGVVGVLALAPGSRSHLRVTPSDILMNAEPEGPDSFAVADAMSAASAAGLRVAVLRGSNDKLRSADSALLSAGPSVRRFGVPLAGHSLRNLTVARYVIREAMDWLLDARKGPPSATR